MQSLYIRHNYFIEDFEKFLNQDPHLQALSRLSYQYSPKWWVNMDFEEGGIYILSGGRQVGKSTSCKLLLKKALENKLFSAKEIFYLPCDEIYTAAQLNGPSR